MKSEIAMNIRTDVKQRRTHTEIAREFSHWLAAFDFRKVLRGGASLHVDTKQQREKVRAAFKRFAQDYPYRMMEMTSEAVNATDPDGEGYRCFFHIWELDENGKRVRKLGGDA